ncbi:family 78 glycoside hydrolase catalytic domain [Actinopolymorpha sp. B9G3]|uniref:family 78 glycoside hydrolase catalytic domain n=1 Tax=Actinopolymorpha sp. B9G3 TaxID=3158970 RepID=UPI0032D8DF17
MTAIYPAALTVDDRTRPLATQQVPRFGWLLTVDREREVGQDHRRCEVGSGDRRDDAPDEGQAAYQIVVTDGSGDIVWDSGKVHSARQGHVPYAGAPLEPAAAYTWTVRVWAGDGDDAPSEWAPAESFEYGLRDEDWHADWIRRAPGGSGPLSQVDGAIRAAGGAATLLREPPSIPADCVVEFRVRVQIRSAGWVLRSVDGTGGYVWRLVPRQGLAFHVLRDGVLGPAEIVPVDVGRDQDHRVVVVARGGSFETSVDGVVVDRRHDGTYATGRFGLFQRDGEQAEFSDLTLRAADGEPLLGPPETSQLTAWDNTCRVRQIDEWTLARREFDLRDGELIRARAHIASHHHADLRVNGVRVGGRASFAYPGEGYYQVVDVTEPLAGSRRAVVGVLLHWYGNGQGRPAAEPGLLVRLVLDYADGARQEIVSDSSWTVCEGPYLQVGYRNDEGDPIEHLDLRRIPEGWDQPGYADDDWHHADVVGRHPVPPFTRLRPQEAQLAEVPVRPVALLTAKDGTPVADFGRVIPARPVVRFAAGVAGRLVRIRAGYNLTDVGRVATSNLLTQGTDMSLPCTQTDGPQTYSAFTHLGFRYLEIPDAGEELSVDDVSAVVVHAEPPSFLSAARFESSDSTLDAVFDLLRTSALYGIQEQFVDTPTREKGQFLADAVNISYATMAALGERTSTRQAIREFLASAERYWHADDERGRYNAVYPNGDGKRDIPDFSLMMPSWVRRYHLESGDVPLVQEAYPALCDTAGYVLRHIAPDGPCAGLVTELAGGGGPYLHGIVDWPAVGRFGYDMATAARTTVNAQGVGVLRDVAYLGRVLGRPEAEVALYDEQADRLVEAINRSLLRPDGRYTDGLLPDGTQSPHAGQHATSFAIAFDVARPEVWEPAADHLESLGMRQGPLTVHHLLRALGRVDRTDAVLRLLTNAEDLGWAKILADGGTFTWEAWTLDEGTNHSQSHGWGAQAAVDVLEFLLGIRVTSPGAERVEVRPPMCALTYARGAVPTARGMVSVDWERSGEEFRVRVDVPANVVATVRLPGPGGDDTAVEVGPGRSQVVRSANDQ